MKSVYVLFFILALIAIVVSLFLWNKEKRRRKDAPKRARSDPKQVRFALEKKGIRYPTDPPTEINKNPRVERTDNFVVVNM